MLQFRHFTAPERALFLTLSKEFYDSAAVDHPIPDDFHHRTFDALTEGNPFVDAYLMEQDGAAAGYALLNRTFQHEAGGMVLWIEELYVRAEFRSRGIGSAFFDFLEHEPSLKACWHRLEVEESNPRAIALYTRRGFERMPYDGMVRVLDGGKFGD